MLVKDQCHYKPGGSVLKLLIIAIPAIVFLTSNAFAHKTYCEMHKTRCQKSIRWCSQHPGKCPIATEGYCRSYPYICDRG